MRHLASLSWFALLGSIALLALVVYQAGAIREEARTRAAFAADREQQSDRSAYAQRVAAVIAETEDERAKLDAFAKLDVVSVVELLESAGTSAGLTVTVAGAQAESGAQLPTGELVQPVAFSVNTSGSYAAVMRALDLYEHLPLASQIEQLDIARDASGSGRTWSLSMRIRIMTLAPSL